MSSVNAYNDVAVSSALAAIDITGDVVGNLTVSADTVTVTGMVNGTTTVTGGRD